jgi:DNA-binding MarR family transcriptional regulator
MRQQNELISESANPLHAPEHLDKALQYFPTLLDRPGFLIRRLHQIHSALFQSETEGFGVTPVQYSVLTTLENGLQRDQRQIALEVGLERSNVADVISRLQARGLVRRVSFEQDRRRKVVKLTPKGARLLHKMQAAVERAHLRTIEVLPEKSRQQFLELMVTLVLANNDQATVPFELSDPENPA